MTDIENTELMLDRTEEAGGIKTANGTEEYGADSAIDASEHVTDAEDEGELLEDEGEEQTVTDYAAIAMRDLAELAEIFPEVRSKRSITELSNPLRYAALRDLGLTPKEAYLATEDRRIADNRAHLTSRVPSSARAGAALSGRELDMARELFSGLSEREIQRLYKKVNV